MEKQNLPNDSDDTDHKKKNADTKKLGEKISPAKKSEPHRDTNNNPLEKDNNQPDKTKNTRS